MNNERYFMNYLKIEINNNEKVIEFGKYKAYDAKYIKSFFELYKSEIIFNNFGYIKISSNFDYIKISSNVEYNLKRKLPIKTWLTEKLGMPPISFIKLWNKTNIDFFEPDYHEKINNILKEIEDITNFPKLLIEVDEQNTRIIYGNYKSIFSKICS